MENCRGTEEKEKNNKYIQKGGNGTDRFPSLTNTLFLTEKRPLLTEERISSTTTLEEPLPQPLPAIIRCFGSANFKIRIPKKSLYPYYEKVLLVLLVTYYQTLKIKANEKSLKIAAIVVGVIIILMLLLPFAFQGKIAGIVKTEGNKMLNAQFDFKKLNISLFRNFPQASVTLEDFWLKRRGRIRKRYPCTSRRGDCHHQSVLPFRRQRL